MTHLESSQDVDRRLTRIEQQERDCAAMFRDISARLEMGGKTFAAIEVRIQHLTGTQAVTSGVVGRLQEEQSRLKDDVYERIGALQALGGKILVSVVVATFMLLVNVLMGRF